MIDRRDFFSAIATTIARQQFVIAPDGRRVFFGDVHARAAAQIFGARLEDVTAEQRRVGKAYNLGLGYGIGSRRLKEMLDARGV